jgi:hypothetical protein
VKRKQPYIARPDEVKVIRLGDLVEIRYNEPGIPVHCLPLDPEIQHLSDAEIVELHNQCLRHQAEIAARYRHVAVEVPLGSPQIKYVPVGKQWIPRGSVLRCEIEDDEDGEIVVAIDDEDLTLKDFGELLTTYIGWGMRIEFVPTDEIHRRPRLEVREPDETPAESESEA